MSSHTRIQFLLSIRDILLKSGPAAAFQFARSAYEAGQIDPRDIAEVFLAVESGSDRFLESLSARPPGGYRFALAQG